jgi:uncharacterized protein YutE (UPF0331/DUF86 family)
MPISEISLWRRSVGEPEDRVSKGLADIWSSKIQIKEILLPGVEAFLIDKKSPLALKYLLIEAVEAISDVCQHLLAKSMGVVCNGYVDCILKAGTNGIIQEGLSRKLRKLADLRNSLIHRYWIIDDRELFNLCLSNLEDLSEFASQVSVFVTSRKA